MIETTLYLTRHGQTEWNLQGRMQGHQDSPLTATGKQQAEWLQERLENVSFEAIYSSTSPRAMSTAHLIQGDKPGELLTKAELREINMGHWEGQFIEDIREQDGEQFHNFWEAPHLYQPSGKGETYDALLERVIPAVEEIMSKHAGGNVLLVTHRITLKVIMGHYLGRELQELKKLPDILSTSLSKIVWRNGSAHVELYGDTSHYKEE
ncbi:histidine phosphatase family protein [Paenibacillus sp. GCM10012306]|uniref:histidine phosphatase family protein n=1 Tax=Paenibacillus sp. GCM10012306 TaxID=3317342 RepID=UPI0036214D81